MCTRHIAICGLSGSIKYFSALSLKKKGRFSEKKVIEHTFDFLYNFFLKHS